ncbi:MAG: CHAT domain-containing tetratricopeptide repeat protein [Chitinophagales bacterium]
MNQRERLKSAEKKVIEAEKLQSATQFKAANDLLKEAAKIYQANGIVEKEQLLYNSIAVNAIHLANYEEALSYLNKALDLGLEKLGLHHVQVGETYGHFGKCYRLNGDIQKALGYNQKALNIFIVFEQKTNISIAKVYIENGSCYEFLGDYKTSMTFYEKGLQLLLQELGGSHPHVGGVYMNMGNSYSLMGNQQQALKVYQKALVIFKNKFGEAYSEISTIYNNIGIIYWSNGDHNQALSYYYKALDICVAIFGENHPEVGRTYANMGIAYEALNQYATALSYHQKGLEIYQSIFGENHPNLIGFYWNMAVCYMEQKNYEQTLVLYNKVLTTLLPLLGSFHQDIAAIYHNMSEIYMRKTNYDKALKLQKKALKSLPAYLIDNHPVSAQCYLSMGLCYGKIGKLKKALYSYQKGLQSLSYDFEEMNVYQNPTSYDVQDTQGFLQLLSGKARTFYHAFLQNQKPKYLQASFDTYLLAIQLISQIRNSYKAEDSKLFLAEKVAGIFEGFLEATWELVQKIEGVEMIDYYLRQVFSFSEQSKAVLLLSNIRDSEAKIATNIPEKIRQKEYDLRIELSFIDKQIAEEQNNLSPKDKEEAEKSKKRLRILQAQHFDYNQEYENLIEKLEITYPKYFQLKYSTTITNVEEIQVYLLKQTQTTALIEYFVGEKDVYIFCITPDNYQVEKIKKPSVLEEWIVEFQEALNMADLVDFVALGNKLYELLLCPIEKTIEGIERLIFIRDDVLNYLPFEGLLKNDSKASSTTTSHFADLPYLLRHFEIMYHYSATLLLYHSELNKTATTTTKASFVGFAPVTFDGSESIELAIESVEGRTTVLRSNKQGEWALKVLPNTENEVKNIYELFELQQLPAKAFLYSAASKKNLIEFASHGKFLLIATHGFIHEQSTNLSGIYLANIKDAENNIAENNFLLTISESYQLQLQNTDLVVLSSCSSGVGKLQKGEGMMAMNRSFLYAGAKNIIFTQFDIPDQSSSLLVMKLFELVLKGESYASALRKAKLYLINQVNKQPRDWLAYCLIGN